MTHRIEKVERLVHEELSLIFLHKIRDPEIGIATITNVKLSPDLKIAKVYVSIYDKEKRDNGMEKITGLTGYIRTELAHRVKMRFVPELKFFIDDTLDYVEKIDELIKKIHDEDNKPDG